MTIKQQIAIKKLVENGGNLGKAMVAAGYSPATAKTPKKLTATKAWKEQMGKLFNDDEVKRQHAFLINQFENLAVKAKGIDMYYKATGKYSININDNESRAKIDQISDQLKSFIDAK